MARHCPAAATLGRFLYLPGGTGTSPDAPSPQAMPTVSVERLDMRCPDGGWVATLAPMLVARYRHACASLEGLLYACGGQKTDGKATSSVERYDPAEDAWVHVAPLHSARFSHAMASFDGHLYVVGGFADGQWLSTVERYDPTSDSWQELESLPSAVSAPGLAVA